MVTRITGLSRFTAMRQLLRGGGFKCSNKVELVGILGPQAQRRGA